VDNDNLLLGFVLGIVGSRKDRRIFATIFLGLQHLIQDHVSLSLYLRQDSVVVRRRQNSVALCELQKAEDRGTCQSRG
jgi:hypothetical protein